jgi:hypothetical protein
MAGSGRVRYWNDKFSITNGESDISFPGAKFGTLYNKSIVLSGVSRRRGIDTAVEAHLHENARFDYGAEEYFPFAQRDRLCINHFHRIPNLRP